MKLFIVPRVESALSRAFVQLQNYLLLNRLLYSLPTYASCISYFEGCHAGTLLQSKVFTEMNCIKSFDFQSVIELLLFFFQRFWRQVVLFTRLYLLNLQGRVSHHEIYDFHNWVDLTAKFFELFSQPQLQLFQSELVLQPPCSLSVKSALRIWLKDVVWLHKRVDSGLDWIFHLIIYCFYCNS